MADGVSGVRRTLRREQRRSKGSAAAHTLPAATRLPMLSRGAAFDREQSASSFWGNCCCGAPRRCSLFDSRSFRALIRRRMICSVRHQKRLSRLTLHSLHPAASLFPGFRASPSLRRSLFSLSQLSPWRMHSSPRPPSRTAARLIRRRIRSSCRRTPANSQCHARAHME